MKVYHTLKFRSYNSACAFLEGRVTVTKVTCWCTEYYLWEGKYLVAQYSELTQELRVYRDLNISNRCYGRLH